MKENIIEQYVSDVITQKSVDFSVKYYEEKVVKKKSLFKHKEEIQNVELERNFTISPPTLGKMQILSKYYLELDIDEDKLQEAPHVESMRICESKTDVVCKIMAVSVLNTKEDLLDERKINELADFFKYNSMPSDFSTILLIILTMINYENFISSIRLTRILRQNKPTIRERANRVE